MVTATRIATPRERVASTVTVIDAEEIERKQYRSVVEALQAVPSLSVVRSGGPGRTTAVFSRGSNANHTLVRLDGVELNDPGNPDGRVDLAGILIADVARIEVLHGPQGTLYGSDAVGAVISIVTRRGQGSPGFTARAEAGSLRTFDQHVRVAGAGEVVDYAFAVQHRKTAGVSALGERFRQPDGVLDDDAHENTTVSARAGAVLSDTFDVDLSARFQNAEDELDLNVFPVRDDSDSRSRSRRWLLAANARLALFDGRTEHRLGLSYALTDRRDADDPDPVNALDFLRDDNRGRRVKAEVQNDLYLHADHVLTVGLETEEERLSARLTATSLFGPFESSTRASARTNAVYVQDSFRLGERVFGTVGARLDDHDRFGSELTWRVAPTYLHEETGTRLRGSLSTGFKAPTLFQLFGRSVSTFGPFAGNPDLAPETSRGWELGVEQALLGGRMSLELVYYRNDIDNLVQSDALGTTNVNLGEARTAGVEAALRAGLGEAVSLGLRYAYTRAEDARTDAELLRRPLHKASFDLTARPNARTTLGLEGVYVGPRHDLDAVTFARVRRGGHFVANLTAAYSLDPVWELFGRVENVLDREYEEPDGFEQPGLGLFVGVQASL